LFFLKFLNLDSNKISINPSPFNGLYSLEKLFLENSKIIHISEKIFNDLIDLKYLNLKSNQIIEFNKDSLFGLFWLQKICMYDNPISARKVFRIFNFGSL